VTATSVADPTKSASAQVQVNASGAGTALAQAAAALNAGTWTEFSAAENASWNGGGLLEGLGGSTDAGTAWSTKGLWNPPTKEFYFVGGAHCGSGSGCPNGQEVLRYADSTNAWSRMLRDGGHAYEGATINITAGTNNNLYFRPFDTDAVNIYDIASQSWGADLNTSVPSAGGPSCCLAMEYFSDRNSLITIDTDWGVYEYSFTTGQWSICLFNTSSSCGAAGGFHTFSGTGSTAAPWARYDAVHKRMLMGGATNVYALSSSLTLTQLASVPFDISSGTSASPVTIDPGTGKLVSWDASGHTFTSDGTSWVNAGPSPFSDPVNGGLACAPVSTYNAILCFYLSTSSAAGDRRNGVVVSSEVKP
jgi:hypothetical protein